MGPEHPDIVRQAADTVAQVRTLWRELFRNPFSEAQEHGLTGPQVTLLATLVSRGPMALTELSRALGMSHSTASGIVDRLQARGLIERTQDPDDRRRSVLRVTERVRQYVGKLELGPSGRVASALARGTAAERRMIRDAFATLARLLEQEGGKSAAAERPGARRRASPPRER